MATRRAKHEALVRRFLTDVVEHGDVDAFEDLVVEDPVIREPSDGAASTTVEAAGFARGVLAAGDFDVDVVAIVADDDAVAVRARVGGTLEGLPLGAAPVGAPFEVEHASFYRVEGDRIAEVWTLPDRLGLLGQLDAFPRAVGGDRTGRRFPGDHDRRTEQP